MKQYPKCSCPELPYLNLNTHININSKTKTKLPKYSIFSEANIPDTAPVPQMEADGGYVEANQIRIEVDGNGYVNMENQQEDDVDEDGYLRPMSKLRNSMFIEEANYSGINPKINHQYTNSKLRQINNAWSVNQEKCNCNLII